MKSTRRRTVWSSVLSKVLFRALSEAGLMPVQPAGVGLSLDANENKSLAHEVQGASRSLNWKWLERIISSPNIWIIGPWDAGWKAIFSSTQIQINRANLCSIRVHDSAGASVQDCGLLSSSIFVQKMAVTGEHFSSSLFWKASKNILQVSKDHKPCLGRKGLCRD